MQAVPRRAPRRLLERQGLLRGGHARRAPQALVLQRRRRRGRPLLARCLVADAVKFGGGEVERVARRIAVGDTQAGRGKTIFRGCRRRLGQQHRARAGRRGRCGRPTMHGAWGCGARPSGQGGCGGGRRVRDRCREWTFGGGTWRRLVVPCGRGRSWPHRRGGAATVTG